MDEVEKIEVPSEVPEEQPVAPIAEEVPAGEVDADATPEEAPIEEEAAGQPE